MEELINISWLNDFVFCPASIYFHSLYEGLDSLAYKQPPQIKGTYAHKVIDSGTMYTGNVISGFPVYSEQYGIIGKIDKYYVSSMMLMECKRVIRTVYDGYIFQLYAQYFGMIESGYEVKEIGLYEISTKAKIEIALPAKDEEMLAKFEKTLFDIRHFRLEGFHQDNLDKCNNCIYFHACAVTMRTD